MGLFIEGRVLYGPIPGLPVVITYMGAFRGAAEIISTTGEAQIKQTTVRGDLDEVEAIFGSPEALRDALRAATTPEEATKFLQECGPWLPPPSEFWDGRDVQYVSWSEFKSWQAYFEARQLGEDPTPSSLPGMGLSALLSGTRKAPRIDTVEGEVRPLTLCDSEQPGLWMSCTCALEAISAIIAVDRMNGIRYKRCEREHGCPNKLFRLGTRENKRFCDEYCRQAEERRNGRRRKAGKLPALTV